MTRIKVAELTSGVGALVLGVGVGALFPAWFARGAVLLAIAGLVLHAFGMWDKHRIEAEDAAEGGPWVTALYWTCWLLLAAVVVVLVLRS